MRVGIAVHCVVCGQIKEPRGRSQPIGAYYCDRDCPGWAADPKVGDLWPRETEMQFGYPVSENGTKECRPCNFPNCYAARDGDCDSCDNGFCSDHGTVGGDRQVQDVGAVAIPSACWKCGGFNVDE